MQEAVSAMFLEEVNFCKVVSVAAIYRYYLYRYRNSSFSLRVFHEFFSISFNEQFIAFHCGQIRWVFEKGLELLFMFSVFFSLNLFTAILIIYREIISTEHPWLFREYQIDIPRIIRNSIVSYFVEIPKNVLHCIWF